MPVAIIADPGNAVAAGFDFGREKEKTSECDDGTVKILYGDTDSKPMYISFSAFKTKEEAEQEGDNILQHDEVYINALTSNAYINQFYSERT